MLADTISLINKGPFNELVPGNTNNRNCFQYISFVNSNRKTVLTFINFDEYDLTSNKCHSLQFFLSFPVFPSWSPSTICTGCNCIIEMPLWRGAVDGWCTPFLNWQSQRGGWCTQFLKWQLQRSIRPSTKVKTFKP